MNDVLRTYTSPMPVSALALQQWHRSPGALRRLMPSWMKTEILEHSGTVDPGDWVRIHATLAGPVGFDWTLIHENLPDPNDLGFADEQLTGPFSAWRHEHRYLEGTDDTSEIEDRLVYQLKAGALGAGVAGNRVTNILDRMFELRHLRTWNDLVRFQDSGLPKPLRIAVTGASGLVGRRLIPFLQGGGHEVVSLVRRAPHRDHEIHWNPATGEIDAAGLEGIDAVVHLAGVSIAGGRWSASRKEAILRSRVDGTRLLATTLAGLQSPPSVFVSTSAVGFYGDTGNRSVTEESSAGEGFLSDVCLQWEAAAEPTRVAGIRVVHPRLGVVFAGDGGMLPLIAKPFKAGVGGKLGSGQQGMPWIGLEDVVGILFASIADERLSGPVNAVSPEATTNADFTAAMGEVLGRPTIFSVPSAPLRLIGGELADELILVSQHVKPARLNEVGFQFAFPRLTDTLRFELGKSGLQPDSNRLPLATGQAV